MRGAGTLADPYIFDNIQDVQDIDIDAYHRQAYYIMDMDIDATPSNAWNGGTGFMPISLFTGNLDGNGHEISGMIINRTPVPADDNQGIFDTNQGIIQNLGLLNFSVTGHQNVGSLCANNFAPGVITNCYATNVTIVGTNDCGGLIGSNTGTVSYCYSSGTIVCGLPAFAGTDAGGLIGDCSAATVSYCYSSAVVLGNAAVGGLIGGFLNNGHILECYATGNVTSRDNDAGGLVGRVTNIVGGGTDVLIRCFATGDVITQDLVLGRTGGLIGNRTAHGGVPKLFMHDCYARGNVTGADDVGGLVGLDGPDGGATPRLLSEDCYSTGLVTCPGPNVGGLVGRGVPGLPCFTDSFWDTVTSGQAASPGGGTGQITAWMTVEAGFIAAGWDFVTVWSIISGQNDNYPILTGVYPFSLPTVSTKAATEVH